MSNHFKKYALLLIAGVVICSVSCKKDSKEGGGDNPDPKPDTGFVIEAKNVIVLNGGSDDDVVTVKAHVWNQQLENYNPIATGKYENGKFKITLPYTLDNKYLYAIGNEDFPEGVNVSDRNAKVGEADYFTAYDEDDNKVGRFIYCDEPNDSWDYIVVCYVYADRNLTITGTYTEVYGNTTEITTFDYSLKKGWNIAYKIEKSDDNCSYFTGTTKKPSDVTLNWCYYEGSWYKTSAATLRDRHFGKILNITKY